MEEKEVKIEAQTQNNVEKVAYAADELEMRNNLEFKMKLEAQFKDGISWFYWIAGLSVINTIINLMNGDWNFIVGLGITQIIDAFANYLYGKAKLIAIIIDFILAGFFALLGYFAGKGRIWVIILGIVLYSLDAILFILAYDWIGLVFHGLAIFGFIRAIIANNKLKKLEM